MDGTFLTALAETIKEVGFPVLVALILLFRVDRKLTEIQKDVAILRDEKQKGD
jgi:hypothetical protein